MTIRLNEKVQHPRLLNKPFCLRAYVFTYRLDWPLKIAAAATAVLGSLATRCMYWIAYVMIETAFQYR